MRKHQFFAVILAATLAVSPISVNASTLSDANSVAEVIQEDVSVQESVSEMAEAAQSAEESVQTESTEVSAEPSVAGQTVEETGNSAGGEQSAAESTDEPAIEGSIAELPTEETAADQTAEDSMAEHTPEESMDGSVDEESEAEEDSEESETEEDAEEAEESETESGETDEEIVSETVETNAAADAVISVAADNNAVKVFERDGKKYLFLPRSVNLAALTISSTEPMITINGVDVSVTTVVEDTTAESAVEENADSETSVAEPEAAEESGTEGTPEAEASEEEPAQAEPEVRTVVEGVTEATVSVPNSTQFTIEFYDGTSIDITCMQSNLPSISINLNGTTLDTIKSNGKDTKYEGNELILTDPDGGNSFSKDGVQVKGRGNSSWTQYDKKGYQIKFEKKQSVLGMEKAKKWVLLANASDPSMVRNAVGFNLAKRLGLPYTSDYAYVDLWFDGDYQGTYFVTEKIEIGTGRVELGENGIVSEHDCAFYEQEDLYFEDYWGRYYTLKDPDADKVGTRFDSFQSNLIQVEKLIAASNASNWNSIASKLNVDSVAKVMLVNDYLLNVECHNTSLYCYQNDADQPIYFGPVWDFDSAGVTYYTQSQFTYYMYHEPLLGYLCKYSAYRTLYKNLYDQNKSLFDACASDAKAIASGIKPSAEMNYIRWDTLGKKDVKGTVFENTYDANVNVLVKLLSNRAATFNVSKSCQDPNPTPDPIVGDVTVYNGVDYSAVYDYDYYLKKNPDVAKVYQGDKKGALKHFVENGMKEGRIASEKFDVRSYLYSYRALRVKFGTNFESYFRYYLKNGDSVYPATTGVRKFVDAVTVKNGVDYSLVYDCNTYLANYDDLYKAFGYSDDAALNHFISNGMNEHRRASDDFDVIYYMSRYTDLRRAFGLNYKSYYMHYIKHGYKEGRVAVKPESSGDDTPDDTPDTPDEPDEPVEPDEPSGTDSYVTVMDNVDYAPVYDFNYYISKYADLKAAFGSDDKAALKHFVVYGMNEGRQASKEFNLKAYKNRYSDLRAAFGNNNKAYYLHYIKYGKKEGRKAT